MGDEREKMTQMNRWLDEVCVELGVDRAVMSEVTGPLLALIKHVAHGPSRPGAPLTAFAVGLASGIAVMAEDMDHAEAVKERVRGMEDLVQRWVADPQ